MTTMVRKAHSKSRQGCMCCKRRHVKCSETRPRCQHCTRLGIECTWPEGSGSNVTSSSQSQSQSQSPAAITAPFMEQSPGPPLPSLQPASNGVSRPKAQPELSVNDLKLLHFYLFNTAATMTAQDSEYLWQNVIVDLGFRHHFLLHGILAVAATHKASIFPAEQEELLVQSASHIEIGLRAFRKCLESPLPATSVPCFIMAGLLSVQSLGTAQVHTPLDPIGDVCTWMRMVRGAKSTIQQNWKILLSSEIGSLLRIPDPQPEHTTEVAELKELRILVEQTSAPGSSEREIYLDCLDQLAAAFIGDRHLANSDSQTSAMPGSFAATVHEGYCELLAQRQPLALVIITYLATLFGTWPCIWWYRNWDSWIINAVQIELPSEYEPWLARPKSKLSSVASTPSAMAI